MLHTVTKPTSYGKYMRQMTVCEQNWEFQCVKSDSETLRFKDLNSASVSSTSELLKWGTVPLQYVENWSRNSAVRFEAY
jgi:hypothetical protein